MSLVSAHMGVDGGGDGEGNTTLHRASRSLILQRTREPSLCTLTSCGIREVYNVYITESIDLTTDGASRPEHGAKDTISELSYPLVSNNVLYVSCCFDSLHKCIGECFLHA